MNTVECKKCGLYITKGNLLCTKAEWEEFVTLFLSEHNDHETNS